MYIMHYVEFWPILWNWQGESASRVGPQSQPVPTFSRLSGHFLLVIQNNLETTSSLSALQQLLPSRKLSKENSILSSFRATQYLVTNSIALHRSLLLLIHTFFHLRREIKSVFLFFCKFVLLASIYFALTTFATILHFAFTQGS